MIIKSFAVFFIISIFFVPFIALGQSSSDCTNLPSTSLCNPIRYSQDDIGVFAFKVVAIFTSFFALTAVIFVVFSGFRMIMSQGNEEAITTARSSLQWSISGLVLALFAFVLISAIGTYIGAKDLDPASYIGNNVARNPLKDTDFLGLITRLLTGFLSVVGILAILMIVIGGFRYVTSRGNEEQTESGKKTLQWAIIGLVTVLLAYVLVRATLTFFGG